MSYRATIPPEESPLEEPDSRTPPLTLSQRLQKNRLVQQERDNERQAELKKRKTEIITQFIVKHIEPLLEEQVVACLSKTSYVFLPSGIQQEIFQSYIPKDKDIVEGFGGNQTAASHYIRSASHKEYIKVVRLTEQEYGMKFWTQPGCLQELEQTLKSRLKANGEKVADTIPDSAGHSWGWRSFYGGETLPPGLTGVEFQLMGDSSDFRVWCAIHFDAEIA